MTRLIQFIAKLDPKTSQAWFIIRKTMRKPVQPRRAHPYNTATQEPSRAAILPVAGHLNCHSRAAILPVAGCLCRAAVTPIADSPIHSATPQSCRLLAAQPCRSLAGCRPPVLRRNIAGRQPKHSATTPPTIGPPTGVYSKDNAAGSQAASARRASPPAALSRRPPVTYRGGPPSSHRA